MVGVDVGIHAYCISSEYAAVVWEWILLFESVEKVPAVLEIGWTQVYYSLQLVVYPDAERLRDGGDAADDGP
jgi:hypothetical protein